MPLKKAIEVCVGDLGLERNSGSQPFQDDLPLLLLGRELQDRVSIHKGAQYSLFPVSPLRAHGPMLLQMGARSRNKSGGDVDSYYFLSLNSCLCVTTDASMPDLREPKRHHGFAIPLPNRSCSGRILA